MVFEIQLDDNSLVDISTEEGAKAYLLGTSNVNLFSSNVEKINKIHRKKRLNAAQKQDIIESHRHFESLANVDSGIFRQKVPESEIQCWIEYTVAEIKRFTSMPKYISTGKLEKHEICVFSTCMSMFNHAIAVVFAFEGDFFQALGDLAKARKGNGTRALLPSEEVCEWISLVVCNGYCRTRAKFDTNWPPERGFRKLDDSGVLAEFLRCATVPKFPEGGQDDQLLMTIFNYLLGCPAILNKRFKGDGACGKVIREILEGKDGSRTPRPDIIRRFHDIVNFVDSANNRTGEEDVARSCHNCGKKDPSKAFQESLMKCGRCQVTYYCSKACQKADWKVHKMMCQPVGKSSRKELDTIRAALLKFANEQYVDIMVKLVRECEKTGTAKKDMLVKLDFRVNSDGIVPAMQNPPMFDVIPTQHYFRPDAETFDWVGPQPAGDLHLQNVEHRCRTIEYTYSRMTPMHALFYAAYNGGMLCVKIDGGNLYSDQVFEAFRSVIIDGNVQPMTDALNNPKQVGDITGDLALKYGIFPEFFPGSDAVFADLMGALSMDGNDD